MQNTKRFYAFLSTYKFFSHSLKCQFFTQPQLQSRRSRISKVSWNKQGPDIRGPKIPHVDDPEYWDDSDIDDADDEINLMKADIAYDEHFREEKNWRQRIGNKIAEQNFFAPRQQPQMLTYNEKLCIKYLHEQDPVQWDIPTLSESFPATPFVIQKVLKSRWKPTQEKIMKMDAAVQKNWKLLEEGKLDADPEVIEHLRKFVNRREILLEQIKSTKFYLPEIKNEKVFNNSEMSSILQSYENEIDNLAKAHNCLVAGSSYRGESLNSKEHETGAIQHLHRDLDKTEKKLGLQGKESFTLNSVDNKMFTHEMLLANIVSKKERNERLDISERAILEFQGNQTHSKYLGSFSKILDSESSNDNGFLNTQVPQNKEGTDKSNRVVQNEKDSKSSYSRRGHTKFIMGDEDKLKYATHVGSNTKQLTELEVGKLMEKNVINEITDNEESRKKGFEHHFNEDPEKAVKHTEFLKRQLEDVQHTAFWNNKENSKEKALRETQKQPLNAPEEENKDRKPDQCAMYKYPEKIKIPKKYIGSGLTFKVNDCYYDDDGEFLFRVPGMKS